MSALFWTFTWLALQGFGGVMTIVQRELIDNKQWLTPEEFVEDWAVAQILPGPNVVNLSLMLGQRYFGWRGSLVALAGMLCLPLCVLLALAAVFAGVSDSAQVQGMLRGMGAVTAGLIMASGLKLMSAFAKNVLPSLVCYGIAAITFVAVAVFHLPLVWVLLTLGCASCGWAYRQLSRPSVKARQP